MARADDAPNAIKPYDQITPGMIPKGKLGCYDRAGIFAALSDPAL